jgi:hypothetical protein
MRRYGVEVNGAEQPAHERVTNHVWGFERCIHLPAAAADDDTTAPPAAAVASAAVDAATRSASSPASAERAAPTTAAPSTVLVRASLPKPLGLTLKEAADQGRHGGRAVVHLVLAGGAAARAEPVAIEIGDVLAEVLKKWSASGMGGAGVTSKATR